MLADENIFLCPKINQEMCIECAQISLVEFLFSTNLEKYFAQQGYRKLIHVSSKE